jgi:uncharacterized OB-fold protein|tara:strand:- start:12 stop:194 length:183 start_codon:yes stop_codon:yes gene_type:complete
VKEMKEEIKKGCACNKQIVWFFDKGTIIACKNCEITFYHNVRVCPHCKEMTTEFIEKNGV